MFRVYLITLACLLSLGVRADRDKLEDPTRPEGFTRPVSSVTEKKTRLLPRLSSVLIGDDRRLAVIDGRVMAEGDVGNGLRVRRINSDRVLVTLADRTRVTLLLDTSGIHKEER
ncbi:MAG: hypothetical protein O7F71_19090 [Gammaproteobacteria bacterium]|nr:hypothetical protein [Gammaproteobacteria bacterium]